MWSTAARPPRAPPSLSLLLLLSFSRTHAPSTNASARPPAQIIIVGMVVEVNVTATNLMYSIEDGTGSVNVKKWIDTDGDAAEPAPTEAAEKGSFVKVTGQLRSFRGDLNVMAFDEILIKK